MNNTENEKTIDQQIQEADAELLAKAAREAQDPEYKKYLTVSAGVCAWLMGLGVSFLIIGSLILLGGFIGLLNGSAGGAVVALGIGMASVIGGTLFLALRAIIMELRYIRLEARS